MIKQLFFTGANGFFLSQQMLENAPVSSQHLVDLPEVMAVLRLQAVIMIVAAIVIAELFITSASYGFSAAKAGPGYSCCLHNTKLVRPTKSIRCFQTLEGEYLLL